MTPAPSNLRRPTIEARDGRGRSYRFIVEPERPEPVRLDPGYDVHRPLSRDDIGTMVRMIPAAVVVLAAFVAVCLFLAAVTPHPVTP